MASWIENAEARAHIVLGQLAAAMALAPKAGLSPEEVARPYMDLLDDLYKNEMPMARLMDTSDLIVELKGPAVDSDSPALRVVSGAFFTIREEAQRVTRAIVGLSGNKKAPRIPSAFELALTGLARGSLNVGVRVSRPSEVALGETPQILGDNDPLYETVRNAIRGIAVVTKHVSDEGIDSSIIDDIPDPAVRDAVSVAAKRLSPTGRHGIATVSLYSPDVRERTHHLTPATRRILTASLRRPVRSKRSGKFEGIVREIDLDARRFEIRNVRGQGAIRCVYDEKLDERARKFLDARVAVHGLVDRAPDGQIRLMQVDDIKIVTPARIVKQGNLKLS